MSKETEKRRRERVHVEVFRSTYRDFPAGELRAGLAEEGEPDCVVTLETGEGLGVEHTQFLRDEDERGSRLKEQESLQDQVVKSAQRVYQRRGGVPLDVMFHWTDCHPIVAANVNLIAENAAAVVAQYVPEDGSVNLDYADLAAWESPRPSEISLLRISRGEGAMRDSWKSSRGDYEPFIAGSEIQRILDGKERKLAGYRRACSRMWLLIVAEGHAPSSYGDTNKLNGQRFVSSFDEVFFFRFFERDVLRLEVLPAGGGREDSSLR